MPNCCGDCYSKIAFRGSGYRAGKIAICDNCCGIDTDWLQMRTRIMNQLHEVALNEGVRRKQALWRPAGRAELESLVLARWASQRRQVPVCRLSLQNQVRPLPKCPVLDRVSPPRASRLTS